MDKNLRVGIVGAGIQGVSNALFLQRKGFNVTIFDRDNPGAQAASYGNAGHFSPYASVPPVSYTHLTLPTKRIV